MCLSTFFLLYSDLIYLILCSTDMMYLCESTTAEVPGKLFAIMLHHVFIVEGFQGHVGTFYPLKYVFFACKHTVFSGV